MPSSRLRPALALAVALPLVAAAAPTPRPGSDAAVRRNAHALLAAGEETFRHDTFGDEAFWSGTLHLDDAIAGAANGGVGDGLSPRAALGVGLKVDADALPPKLLRQLRAGALDLDHPATTLALLGLNAVVGVEGTVTNGRLESVGVTCALCHSTVDDAVAPGIGRRLDGWPNRDLDVGTVIALAPDLAPVAQLLGVDETTLRTVLASWGPGKFDAEVFLDGRALRPDGVSGATLIPPAYGLGGVNLHTYTGWGSIPYWNAFVATLEMHGEGTFVDARLADPAKYPIAARTGAADVRPTVDRVTPTLAGLQLYQLALPVPTPPRGSFDPAAAARGAHLFAGRARCATCHVPPLYTEPGWNMHTAAEISIDDFQASRAPDGRYRTTPLRGLASHQKGGFYHDGRFATLADVVRHYDATFGLGLDDAEVADLVEFLKSL
jgi:mono/diheme cytochrome c family protein